MLFKKIRGLFSNDLSIDLGTANTLIYVKGQGIVLDEPSVVAIRQDRMGAYKSIAAVGREAKQMLGRTPKSIEAIRPMKDGVIADFFVTEKMLQYFIKQVHSGNFMRPSPRVLICVPAGATQVERRAIRESAIGAGAREVYLIEEPMAAAIGAKLPVSTAIGSMVIDIGGGTTEIGVVSLGGLVISKSIRTAGDKIDISIVNYIKEKYNLLIGERAGEDIKISVGSAIQLPEELSIVVKGRDQISGLLSRVELTSEDVREAMREPLKEIADALKTVLEMMPPDLAGDIVENGIVLTGGGALIRGIDKYLSDIVKLPVFVADEPLLAVAIGTGKALEEIKFLQQLVNEE